MSWPSETSVTIAKSGLIKAVAVAAPRVPTSSWALKPIYKSKSNALFLIFSSTSNPKIKPIRLSIAFDSNRLSFKKTVGPSQITKLSSRTPAAYAYAFEANPKSTSILAIGVGFKRASGDNKCGAIAKIAPIIKVSSSFNNLTRFANNVCSQIPPNGLILINPFSLIWLTIKPTSSPCAINITFLAFLIPF